MLHDLSVKAEVFYLFHAGDVAGDVLYSGRILYGQSVALALHPSSVNDDPRVCGQACRSEESDKVCRIDVILKKIK